jgi:hypothetical protein
MDDHTIPPPPPEDDGPPRRNNSNHMFMTPHGQRARAAHRARLEAAAETVMEIMARDHVHVSQGRVMKDDNGIPLIDDGPKLAAAEKIRALSESLRKLDGLDAATKVDTSITITPQDAELQERLARARAAVAAEEDRLRGNSDE